ncbi:hypothetical protein OAF53_01340 [Akkermansiaceae bacterium]|nr:hypothetical protein [Akkermansiaceae bacterium]
MGGAAYNFIQASGSKKIFEIPLSAAVLNKVKVPSIGPLTLRVLEYDYSSSSVVEVASFEYPTALDDGESVRIITPNLRLEHKDTNAYFLELSRPFINWAIDAPLIMEYTE